MRKLLAIILSVMTMAAYPTVSQAQQVGFKTNLLYDAVASPSIGAEMRLAPKWSLEVTGNFCGWEMLMDKKWKHWMVQPEARYWFCEALHGHFIGVHALGGEYNFGGWGLDRKVLGIDFPAMKTHRFQGWCAGGGLNYGYAWILGKHFNLEAELGVGYLYCKYDEYKCSGCGLKTARGVVKHYVGPTELAVNLVYIF